MKKISDQNRLKLMFYSSVEAFAVPIIMFIATPVLLNNIGTERFGLWVWINAAAAFCGFLNFNFAESVQTLAAEHKNKISLFFANFFGALMATFVSLIIAIIFCLTFSKTVVISEFNLGELLFPLIGAIAFFSLRFLENTILSFFKAHLLFAHSSLYSFFSKSFGLGTQVFILSRGGSFGLSYAIGAIITLSFILIESIHVIRKYSLNFRFVEAKTAIQEFSHQKNFLAHSWIQNATNIMSANIDKILVGTFLSPVLLTYYAIATLIIAQIHLLFSSAFQIIVPEFASSKISSSTKRKRYFEYNFLLFIGFLVVAFLLFSRDQFLVRWWLKVNADGVVAILPALLFFEFFFVMNVVPYYALMAKRKMEWSTQIMVPMLLCLIGTTTLLKLGYGLEQFIFVRAGIVFIGCLAFHIRGFKLVFSNL